MTIIVKSLCYVFLERFTGKTELYVLKKQDYTHGSSWQNTWKDKLGEVGAPEA